MDHHPYVHYFQPVPSPEMLIPMAEKSLIW